MTLEAFVQLFADALLSFILIEFGEAGFTSSCAAIRTLKDVLFDLKTDGTVKVIVSKSQSRGLVVVSLLCAKLSFHLV